jgi:hypothetical protein
MVNTAGRAILLGLQSTHGKRRPDKHVYAGTVPAATVQQRRTKNKLARAARRANRKASR